MDWLTDWRCWDLSKRFLLQGSASTCYITVLPSQHDLNWVFSSTWSRCIIFCLLHYISIGPKKPAWSLWIKGKQSKAMNTFLPCLSLFFHFFLPALATIGWLLTWYTHSYPYRINRSNLEDLLFWAMCYILKRTVSWRIIDEAWPKHHTIFLCSAVHTTIHKAMEQPSGASLGSEWCPEYLILPEVTSSITH